LSLKVRFGQERWSRWANAAVFAGSSVVIGVAAWLDPSPKGYATHLQLGLQPCTFLTFTGYPCPMCGMTTTFALMADGRPVDALRNQPFGVVLFVATVAVCGIALAEVLVPRKRWSRLSVWVTPYELFLAIIFFGGLGLGWLYKIAQLRG
jgi:hypothetical protein